jgi:hypothetical protein
MHCRDAEELIALHVGDDLAEHEAAALEGHLEGCALCEADYASFARAREALLMLREEEAPLAPPLWSAVAEGLDAPVAAAPAGRLRRMAVGFGIAAALAIGASAPLWLPGSTPLEPDNPGTTLAEGEDEGPDIRSVSPEELRRFFNSWTGAWPHAAEEEVELMAPASNRGEM